MAASGCLPGTRSVLPCTGAWHRCYHAFSKCSVSVRCTFALQLRMLRSHQCSIGPLRRKQPYCTGTERLVSTQNRSENWLEKAHRTHQRHVTQSYAVSQRVKATSFRNSVTLRPILAGKNRPKDRHAYLQTHFASIPPKQAR